MKTVSLVAPLLCGVSVLMLAPLESHAGEWRLATKEELAGKANVQGSYEHSGTSESHEDAYEGGYATRTTSAPAWDEKFVWGSSGSSPMKAATTAPKRNTGTAHFKGKMRAWLIYIPRTLVDPNTGRPVYDAAGHTQPDPDDKPPSNLSVLVRASGNATATDGGKLPSQQIAPPSKLYITSPDAYKATVSVNGQSSPSVPDASGKGVTATKSVLVLQSVADNGAMLRPTPWLDFDVAADVTKDARYDVFYNYNNIDSGQYQTYIVGGGAASGTYAAQIDSRTVKLTRNDKDKFEFIDGVWTTYGKTCYSYDVTYSSSDVTYPNPESLGHKSVQPFTASVQGNWSSVGTAPSITWNWTPGTPLNRGNTTDSKYYAQRIAPFGGLLLHSYIDSEGYSAGRWSGTGIASQTATITYDVTDQGDGAKATAKYVLEVHEPIEKVRDFSIPVWAYCPIWHSSSSYPDPSSVMQVNGPINADGQNNPSVTFGNGATSGMDSILSGEFSYAQIRAVLGLSGGSGNSGYFHSVDNSVNQNQTVNIDVPANYFTYPLFEDKYIRHQVSYRHFTDEGEHELASFEFPPGSGFYDTPLHEILIDEPAQDATIIWAPPQPRDARRVPEYTDIPATPTPYKSGGYS